MNTGSVPGYCCMYTNVIDTHSGDCLLPTP